ncbi:hypothetical protein JEM51_00085 [Ligilactobacillus agilis]|uniref:hypothetical protein n=1 Tax=Ligilactobacillus agilis TaxID=1601 RepID=UPI00191D5414|nr:hypothetical protein [Ligilactobacillus agilis]MBL1054842.1 hypothetical protein [Ligilactobacillus agilis]
MNNNLFVAVMLDCGVFDLYGFFAKLDNYDEFTINTLNREIDTMAVESALRQVESSEEFKLAIWDGFNGYYNAYDNKFWFDNVKELKTFDEWKEFANLLNL